MDADTSSFPELNKYMDLIISEQKALLDEINSFIEDIQKIKKNFKIKQPFTKRASFPV